MERKLQFFRENWWPFALIAVILPMLAIRATWAYTIWGDETYTVMIAHHSVSALTKHTAYDATPPLYYVTMHYWLRIGEMLGVEGLLWARVVSMCGWIASVLMGWFGAKKLIGRDGAWLCALLLAINPQLTFSAVDMRTYSVVMPPLFACFLLLLIIYQKRNEAGAEKHSARLWVVYTLAASMALWTHLFASIVMFFIGCLWICLSLSVGKLRHSFVMQGFLAHAIAAAGFLPWLVKVPEQLEFYNDLFVWWIAEPKAEYLLGVFTLWYPGGRFGATWERWATWAPFIMSMLALAPVVVVAGRAAASRDIRRNPMLVPVCGATLVPFLYVFTLYLLSVTGTAHVFDPARYPVLAAPVWIFGMAAAATLAARGWKYQRAWSYVICFAWLWLAYVGTRALRDHDSMRRDFIRYSLPNIAGLQEGDIVYTSFPVLNPYIKNLFPRNELHALPDLRDTRKNREKVFLLLSPGWLQVQPVVATQLGRLAEMHELSKDQRRVEVESGYAGAIGDLHVLKGEVRVGKLQALSFGKALRTGNDFANAPSVALPEDQFAVDGYQMIEITSEYDLSRWTRREAIPMRFTGELAPGDYVLRINMHRQPYPAETVMMTFQLKGEDAVESIDVPSGSRTVDIPMRVTKTIKKPIVMITHPIWRPCDFIKDSLDKRKMGFYFARGWFEKR